MTPETLRFLLGPSGRAAVEGLSEADLRPGEELRVLGRLRRTLAPEEAAAALSLARLRVKAAGKFPEAGRLFFLPEALEQATARPLAARRAAWIDAMAPPGPVLELGAGIGGDTMALAAVRPVVAFEADPLRAALVRANLEALGLADRVEIRCEDWTSVPLPPAAAAFADPARRADGRRRQGLEEMEPPLSRLLATGFADLAVKVAPGLDGEPPGCAVEFVGVPGECREAVLWFGGLRGPGRRAAVWRGDRWETLVSGGAEPPVGDLGPVLYEPEPCAVRAGALAELCEALEAHLFDARIAWLTGSREVEHPLARAFRIEEVHHFSLRRLQERVRALGIARAEIKKRGFAMEPEELRRRLRLERRGRDAVILLTRRGEEPLFLIATRASS